jgi:cyclic beta-1,2-glucan synthetase
MNFRSRLPKLFKGKPSPWDNSQPIKAELFGIERFREHAHSLARSQAVSQKPVKVYSVVRRLRDNAHALAAAYSELSAAVAADKAITPASEWLIDNYHLIEEHVRQATLDLPQGYYRQLPKIAAGPLAGHPQIFGIAWAYVAHTDSRFDPHTLTEFVNAYQEVMPLTIGEVWAAAISLRLVLLENLTRISLRTVAARRGREAADQVADKLLGSRVNPVDLDAAIPHPAATHVELSFAVQLLKRLRDQDTTDPASLEWLRRKIHKLGYDDDSAVNDEHHRQAATNVTMRNLVTSMRFISDYNWEDWFDGVSLVDRVLRGNASYSGMDFRTRNDYRSAIEDLAQRSSLSELEVARLAVEKAGPLDPGHVIVGEGRGQFEQALGYRPTLQRSIGNTVRSLGLTGYLGSTSIIALLVLGVGLWPLAWADIRWPYLVLLASLAAWPALDASLALVNYALGQFLRPVVLPGLAFREGVPPEHRTLVTIPALLTSHADIEELVERLEVHYLANSGGEIHFALLTDWVDSSTEHTAEDDALLATAMNGIARLNLLHSGGRFILMHRRRMWNPQQGKWMGWERKRGKLHEMNRLLRGAIDTSFIVVTGRIPEVVKFVLTLDADTRLPRDAARRLVGKIAHPLNRPRFDPRLGRVVQGYGVLQPRVTPSLPIDDNGTKFQLIYSAVRGSDPYAFAVSDVYQDLFGEGSFSGKGIYDIEAFEAALAGRIPENTMLSHDLFEGTFARAALVSDIEVVEDYPDRYAVAAARQHRWVRGDWQLLPWILGVSLPPLGLWKMVDNLRRSLSPVFTIFALLAGWLVLPDTHVAAWSAFVVLAAFLSAFLPIFSGSSLRPSPNTAASQFRIFVGDLAQSIALTSAQLAFLGHQAGLMSDAIIRTMHRLYFTRRNLLEWTTAAQSQSTLNPGLAGTYRFMVWSLFAGILTLGLSALRLDAGSLVVLPFAILWVAAPALAWWISQPELFPDELDTSPADRSALRLIARRTWRYFETFVTPAENMLPPDNYQEDPKPVIAHRTSPTNIGLYLLSVASAREFGWIGLERSVQLLEATLATTERMDKFKGHLFNWYDTQTLVPLEPRYVSAVDSGNLAGHLIALANACTHWSRLPATPATDVGYLIGIQDTANILSEELEALSTATRQLRNGATHIESLLRIFCKGIERARAAPELLAVRLIELAVQASAIRDTVATLASSCEAQQKESLLYWSDALAKTVECQFQDASAGAASLTVLNKRLAKVSAKARDLALGTEFGFLLNKQRNLMSIGYRVSDGALDENCYDMLASEAALASFFAIAKGDLRARHWFRLSRPVTALTGGAALVSWSGSMFEYLMPSLVLRTPAGSLIERTARLVVRRQIEYGAAKGTPWGISESAFAARDVHFTYQYSNFGVPGLGLKRGLADNLVIAPYATGLAAMVAPRAAARNFHRLLKSGGRGAFGFYEALDFTPARLRSDESVTIVRAYFAHHQGMTVISILNAVNNGSLRRNFHDEPMVRATELLLQERAPRHVPATLLSVTEGPANDRVQAQAPAPPRRAEPLTAIVPVTHLLSNGQYTTMLTAAGTGFSSWKGIAINRWREDPTCNGWGTFMLLRDTANSMTWPAGYMPQLNAPDTCWAEFTEEKAEIHRTDGTLATTLECLVSPEDNAEARNLSIVNSGKSARTLDVTTYMELALSHADADAAHPAFSKLFVKTEYLPDLETLIATRRKRSPHDPDIWVAQFILVNGRAPEALQYETSRAQFIGKGHDMLSADAMTGDTPLGAATGFVLDAVFAYRLRTRLRPGQKVTCTLWTVAADSRAAVLNLVDTHRQNAAYERARILAWTQARIQLRHLSVDAEEANVFQALAGHLIYANSILRPPSQVISGDIRAQSLLWPQSISGTKPILLVRIDSAEDIGVVRELLRAHEYWNAKRLAVDLVVLNDRRASYMQDLQVEIEELVRKSRDNVAREAGWQTGQVYTLRADLLASETLAMLAAVARVVITARQGSLAAQLTRLRLSGPRLLPPKRQPRVPASPPQRLPAPKLLFDNGYGGFDDQSREYVIDHDPDNPLPAPWINVIANENFGTHCSADGAGYTWVGNSRECQITPWSNDPLSNRCGEAVYVQDMEAGVLTGPAISPLRHGQGSFRTRHGFGYTTFEGHDAGLRMELTQFVPLTDSLKVGKLRISTASQSKRELRVTFFAELLMGSQRDRSAPFITTEMDGQTGAMLVRNRWNADFGERVVFADLLGKQTAWSGDRREFLGPTGDPATPLALMSAHSLSKRTGGGHDPCVVLQLSVSVDAATPAEVTILLGSAANTDEARKLIQRVRMDDHQRLLQDVKSHWSATLGAVQVRTPDSSLDLMLNGWLLYQSLSCRMWARSGFYQASGAFGFRDQLQDTMALVTAKPEIARSHILYAASRQFIEGDVQHWWLPATGMGVRTRISDDTVWLAYCTLHYVRVTGDTAILDETVPFLEGRGLEESEHDAFYQPVVSSQSATLYEHCALALSRNAKVGPHGLPLIGTGDWNDGMNRVGEKGKGESVWLGWFLCATVEEFITLADKRGDAKRSALWRRRISKLQHALDEHGWDGKWYRRGYFDDGTPLGSALNPECKIDAIAQSWAVISGVGRLDRAAAAMAQAHQHLVRPSDGVVALFTPPFELSSPDPGYIKAYPPGIRENGGQYTHGVIWSIFAHAKLGQAREAHQLFSLLNPVNHSLTPADARRYKVEPYVIAADIYGVAPHTGHGGWTWYTGAAGWMYRAGLEAILGIRREGKLLRIKPCIPGAWPGFNVSLNFAGTQYDIAIVRNGTTTISPLVTVVSEDEYEIRLQDESGRIEIELRLAPVDLIPDQQPHDHRDAASVGATANR